jgi:beta-glucosidase
VYGEGVFAGYRGYDARATEVAFPFGHGLGYTTWALGAAEARAHGDADGDDLAVTVSVAVTNTGARAGTAVVQCYVHDVESTVRRPPRELATWKRVHAAPGETRTVELILDRHAFAFWHPTRHAWTVEPGAFEIGVGWSSRDLPSRTTVHL